MFHYRLRSSYTVPYAFADNWSWLTSEAKEQLKNWIIILNFVAALRVKIDVGKSWIWGSNAKTRDEMGTPDILFPNQGITIEIKSHVKDLGEIQQYDKHKFSEPLISRMKDAKVTIVTFADQNQSITNSI